MIRRYALLAGYARVVLDEKTLERWRTGRGAANPAEAQALVREIDRLRELEKDLENARDRGGVQL